MSREEQGSNCHPLQKIYIDRHVGIHMFPFLTEKL
jgi:hypothetical protein